MFTKKLSFFTIATFVLCFIKHDVVFQIKVIYCELNATAVAYNSSVKYLSVKYLDFDQHFLAHKQNFPKSK